jgi:hypothetical protein
MGQMAKIKAYYFIERAIKSCRTIAQLEACERMINNMYALFAKELANKALIKKCELLTTQYPEE